MGVDALPWTEADGLGVDMVAVSDDLIMLPESRAARAAEITLRRMRSWADSGVVQPTVVRELSERSIVRIYDFQATVELMVAAELRRRGISQQHLRTVLDDLRSRNVEAPLRQLVFATQGRDLYYQWDDGEWEGGRRPGQGVLATVMLDLDVVRARVRDAARPSRAQVAGTVERRRGRVGSKPVFAGTRIPVATVQGYLAAGFDVDRILDAFPDLLPADVETARGLAS